MSVSITRAAHEVLEAIARLEERHERATVTAVATEAGKGRNNTHRHMVNLRRAGLLEVVASTNPKGGTPIVYRVRRPDLATELGAPSVRYSALVMLAATCPCPATPCDVCLLAADQSLRRLERAGLDVVRSERDHRVLPGQQALRLVR